MTIRKTYFYKEHKSTSSVGKIFRGVRKFVDVPELRTCRSTWSSVSRGLDDAASSRFESKTTAAWSSASTSVERCRRDDDVTDDDVAFECLRTTVDNTRCCIRTPTDVRTPDDIVFLAWKSSKWRPRYVLRSIYYAGLLIRCDPGKANQCTVGLCGRRSVTSTTIHCESKIKSRSFFLITLAKGDQRWQSFRSCSPK